MFESFGMFLLASVLVVILSVGITLAILFPMFFKQQRAYEAERAKKAATGRNFKPTAEEQKRHDAKFGKGRKGSAQLDRILSPDYKRLTRDIRLSHELEMKIRRLSNERAELIRAIQKLGVVDVYGTHGMK